MDHPNDGERLLMIGHLAARGIIVPRVRVRAFIHHVDSDNTAVRRSVYSVEGPNAVWNFIHN